MKRFLAFAGLCYYPCAGFGDFKGDFDTLPQAKAALRTHDKRSCEWWQVVDTETKAKVAEGDYGDRDPTD